MRTSTQTDAAGKKPVSSSSQTDDPAKKPISSSSGTDAAGNKPVSSSSPAGAAGTTPVSGSAGADKKPGGGRALTEMERAVLWEVKKAQGYVDSFQKLRNAHSLILSLIATVNLVAYLQPPKGWRQIDGGDGDTSLNAKSIMYDTGCIEAFAIANSLSLYSAISGLLFFLYCSNPGVLAMAASKMPANPNNSSDRYSELRIRVLHRVRACLRCVVLPCLRHRLDILSTFVASSLTFSLMAFIASGLAAASPQERLLFVIVPAIPGCILVIIFLAMALQKHREELDFDKQFGKYWEHILCVEKGQTDGQTDGIPPIEKLKQKDNLHRNASSIMEVDRIPLLTCLFPRRTECCKNCADHVHGTP